jgi:L-ascorbate metabolism protein UlaG (beta-lactamase superfamily)
VKTSLSLPRPAPRNFHYQLLGHCSFAVSDGKSLVLIDPFFSGRFTWLGKVERHLDPPSLPLASIRHCDAILISHEHGDHYDPATLGALLRQTPALIHAPRQVIRDAVRRGLDRRRFREVFRRRPFRVGRLRITPLGSAGSEKANPIDRVGFLIEAKGCALFHQGDSHGVAADWLPHAGRWDALIMWPHRVAEAVLSLHPKSIVFHHLDRFKPGDFFCNRSAALELKYWRHYHPKTRFVVPPRNAWLPVRPI